MTQTFRDGTLGIALHQNYESWAGLAVALVEAYAGKLARYAIVARAYTCRTCAGSEITATGRQEAR